ncbi:hypothetical protein ABLB90_09725 [Photorhabdus bodei]|uniref:Uncharacterized protein n=1 Tax=Photorhabdus kayaii TaxID=230088 RepID=A0ABX0B3S1_9GAMM|nr:MULTISPECIES: hypothetical protein [Photorhabdus]MCC8375055.1 hypothetical protein [Photorhabdus bodei]MDB6370131.1 hypothetical protein [Photorhabdus bodei]NDL14205.1 hypothetical protein [Photorhabdus kayaii]NDL27721.1 hypothetical protein [Photorhabdus kayaii]
MGSLAAFYGGEQSQECHEAFKSVYEFTMKGNFDNLAADVSIDMILKEHRTIIHYFSTQ